MVGVMMVKLLQLWVLVGLMLRVLGLLSKMGIPEAVWVGGRAGVVDGYPFVMC